MREWIARSYQCCGRQAGADSCTKKYENHGLEGCKITGITCDLIGKFFLSFFTAVGLVCPATQRDTLDPAFERVPFDRWLAESSDTSFHWKARVARAELSFHQRLVTAVEIALDGKDLETRRKGEMVFLIQITGSGGARYQHHSAIDLSKLDENIKAADLEVSHRTFILPGDYRLAVALFDTATGEHATMQTPFRVAQPLSDFLPDAWRDLPAVEFIENEPSPDSWFLPGIKGRLRWADSAHSPPRLAVILNVAPTLPEPGSRHTPSSGMGALLPVLKALSETGSTSLSESVDLLDLGRRRNVFRQDGVQDLDWPRLKTALGDANTASIDVHSLADRHHEAQFFVSEVRKVLRESDKPSVLVVLTTAVAFESGEDLEPISLEALPAARVFYIRYRSPVQLNQPYGPQLGRRGRGGRMGGGPMMNQNSHGVVDQLEATMKPLHPKVFDVETAEQVTKALKEIRNALVTFDGAPAR